MISLIITLALLIPFITCGITPVLIASHKLVPNLNTEISDSNINPHNTSSVTNLLKKLVTQCSSDAYLIVDQPGLTYKDLTKSKGENWPYLRNYLYMSSSIVGLPKVDTGIDWDYIEKYIIKTCDAETLRVHQGEAADYYDIRTRVIRMTLDPLPDVNREQAIREHDQLIRKNLRKLPSPHYTLILTSSNPGIVHPVPEFVARRNPENFEIFSDIVHDAQHNGGVEKNDRFHKPEPNWNSVRDSNGRYFENKKKDELHLFDSELWAKNEKLVTTVLVMVLSLFMIKTFSVVNSIKRKVIEWRTPSSGGYIAMDKKRK
ncbi:uncharacterized protein LODBEIA_P03940 [Lodderomyces beijingensis]|uniref:Protein BIG1 n=1 Tax=Lodderomyces beijingensis TaxID=1775926 RepID=A0ABP0ZG68_9ASCO